MRRLTDCLGAETEKLVFPIAGVYGRSEVPVEVGP
jgi:hypothetical protein